MADEQQQQPAEPRAESEVVVTVDAEGNVVDEGDPAGAMVLRGADAERALERRQRPEAGPRPQSEAPPEDKAADTGATKARKAPPEDK